MSTVHSFDCQLYVTKHGVFSPLLPLEPGPKRVSTFTGIEYRQLMDPGFRQLLAAFETIPQA
jgi:hypothetical protein